MLKKNRTSIFGVTLTDPTPAVVVFVIALLLSNAAILLVLWLGSGLTAGYRVSIALAEIFLAVVVLVVFYGLKRRLRDDIKRILLIENELQEANQRLEASNQQMRANEQQLSAANQQLQAGEQQLRAANLQLSAHQSQLVERENQYRLLFTNMSTAFAFHRVICDEQGKPVDYEFLQANSAFSEFTGLDLKKVIGSRVTELIPGIRETLPNVIEMYGTVALTGSDLHYEFFFEPLGRWYSVVAYCPMHGYFAVVFTDITARVKSEEVLRATNQQLVAGEQQLRAVNQQLVASEQQLRATVEQLRSSEENLRRERNNMLSIFSAMPDGVCIISQDYQIQYANPAIIKEFGPYDGRDYYDYFYGNNQSGSGCLNEEVFQARKTVRWEMESPKTFRTYEHIGTPIDNPDGSLAKLEIMRDITTRRKTEAELQKAHKLESLGVLAGGIAHDFNNLLGGAFGYIDMAIDLTEADSVLHRYLERSMSAYARAKELSSQLLTFSKGGTPVKKVLSPALAIREASVLAMSGSNCTVSLSLDESLPNIEADEGQLSQVINNILLNARQAMPEGGTVAVTLSALELQEDNYAGVSAGTYVRIAIRDQGTGIAPNHIDKIFDPFFTTKQQGSGLGLATSYSIIKNHGGHISVESELGRGTVFVILMPASAEMVAVPEAISRSIVGGVGKLLVMDDESVIRSMARELLGRAGYTIDTACDGVEAIELYKRALESDSPYDAVILDLTIPAGMGGAQVIAELSKIDPGVKAIVSSGYAESPIVSNFAAYGFRGAVSKPYRIRDLCDAVKNVMESR